MSEPRVSPSPEGRPLHVLLVRAGALGDVLLLRRTIASLKQAGHSVSLLAPTASGSALLGPGLTGVDRCLSWDGVEVSRFLADGHLSEGALRDVLVGSDAVVAYTRSDAVTRMLQKTARRLVTFDPEPARDRPCSWWLTGPLRALGVTAVEAVPSDLPSPKETRDGQLRSAALAPGFLAVHPGSGSRLKNWPAVRFAEVIRGWQTSTGRRSWLLCLGPAEGQGPSDLKRLEPDVIARDWPPRALGATLARAGAYVGNDSGVTHLAAAWGAPTLALFGPTDPDVWSPCGVNTCIVRSPTARMEDLPVESVLDQLRLLSRPEAPL